MKNSNRIKWKKSLEQNTKNTKMRQSLQPWSLHNISSKSMSLNRKGCITFVYHCGPYNSELAVQRILHLGEFSLEVKKLWGSWKKGLSAPQSVGLVYFRFTGCNVSLSLYQVIAPCIFFFLPFSFLTCFQFSFHSSTIIADRNVDTFLFFSSFVIIIPALLLPISYMTLVPQLNPPTQHQAALLLMTAAPTGSNFPPVAWGGTVTASGAPSAACVNQVLQGLSVIKVSI